MELEEIRKLLLENKYIVNFQKNIDCSLLNFKTQINFLYFQRNEFSKINSLNIIYQKNENKIENLYLNKSVTQITEDKIKQLLELKILKSEKGRSTLKLLEMSINMNEDDIFRYLLDINDTMIYLLTEKEKQEILDYINKKI